MRIKRMLSELVDVPRMEEDKEGLLRGGFVMLNGVAGMHGEMNENCSCNSGPECKSSSDTVTNKNCNCNCSCADSNKNCDCNDGCAYNENCIKSTEAPKPTDPPKEPVSPMIAGFGLFF